MNDTWWSEVLDIWPLSLFVPGILVMLAVLALTIRYVDGDK